MRSLQDFKKISILEVRGYCYGWHFYQAADADLVIASEEALFGHAAFRYAGWAARQWQWCTMMGIRNSWRWSSPAGRSPPRRCRTATSSTPSCPFDELEATTEKYALACARSRPTDTVFAQKTFFEIYKQHQGEYMGSVLAGLLESMGRRCDPIPTTFELDRETFDNGLANSVKDNDENFPPDWRLSHRGRGGGVGRHPCWS